MLYLPNITLIAIATQKPEEAISALEYSCRDIEFGAVKLVSDYQRPNDYTGKIQFEYIPKFIDIQSWNHYIVYHLHLHVDTGYAILIHEDGFIVNPDSWRGDFLRYDYIGAPWNMPTAIAIQGGREQELVRVGNSVSLRSKRLMELPSRIGIPWRNFNPDFNEDTFICANQRKYFIAHGCRFAPVEVAVHFSREQVVPEGEGIEPFAFHKYHNTEHPNWRYKNVLNLVKA